MDSVGCDGDHFDILIVGELIKLSSYYSGRWVSQYSVDMTDSTIHITGIVSIASHYFENGNVRMNVRREMPPIQLSLSNGVATKLFERIAAFEDEIQEGLNEIFTSLKQDALKTFRRQLPRTRQHFQWNVNAHKMADTMKGMNK
ncbi:uncharacterized protein [Blastocystis hominis]|uniref:F-actin-capping protein subunit alpha n=1 Tax=Blastocystis hominis TaxID=12968 RepID=D8M3I4_BLAHO|nr:uncharacterized protein [Blastocystis hominis]CBK22457.2 unnamed protein product [Blastocystis hominis]|eukprot:XP_012896505.1 uncharacterized protein [Blastocystis hominis]